MFSERIRIFMLSLCASEWENEKVDEIWSKSSFFLKPSLTVIYSFSSKLSEISDKAPTDLALGFGSGHRLQ